jgi:nitrite reductase (NO-forming)
MQGEFYTVGRYGETGLQPFSMEKALLEHPDYVVFNGAVGALAGDKSITAEVGESVRLYVGNGGPNLISSFHVIGEIFDTVYVEGGDLKNTNVQTTLVPAGGSTIVDFRVEVPGTYILVDHSLLRTFNKGTLGMLKVQGQDDRIVYSGKLADEVYQPEGQSTPAVPVASPKAVTLADRMAHGERIYQSTCFACHQANGQGLPGIFPPLAASDYLLADKNRAIAISLKGLSGEIVVNGKKYNSIMTPQLLDDEGTANVLTFVLNAWGNAGGEVTPAEVAAVRARLANTPDSPAHP